MDSVIEKQFKNHTKFTPNELLFKFVILGDYGVGKTSIIKRYTQGKFSSNYKITLGVEFVLKRIVWWNGTRVNLQLWDIAGHERFGHLTRIYYKYAVGAIVVFDLSRIEETFSSIENWIIDLKSKLLTVNDAIIQFPIVLLANKSDVSLMGLNVVPIEQINMLCEKYHILAWFLSSAKENTNIDEAINLLLEKVMENCGTTNNKVPNNCENVDLKNQLIENRNEGTSWNCCR